MPSNTMLPQVDRELTCRVAAYSDEFWSSVDRDPREDIHAYFQYPAMMVPGIQRELIQAVRELQPMVRNILDPFVGSGTTMTDSMPLGLNFTGQDINPLAVLITRTKKGPFFHRSLSFRIDRVLERIAADNSQRIEADFPTLDKWFQPDVQIALSKIGRAVRTESQLWARRFMWVALAETVRLTSNSRTSTYKLHIRPREEIESRQVSAIEVFKHVLAQNLDDLKAFKDFLDTTGCLRNGRYTGSLSVHLQDSSTNISPPPDDTAKYDLLVTSPPYGDNTSTVPYGQHSYLPLQWIDLGDIDKRVKGNEWLRTTQEIDRRSLGGKRPRDLEPQVSYLTKRSSSYRKTVEELMDKPRDRRARVTVFLYDLAQTLKPIISIMRPNAYLIWIVGNRHVGGIEIPTDKILTELLTYYHVTLVTRAQRKIVFRRMAARNRIASMMRQEHVLIFRKVGE